MRKLRKHAETCTNKIRETFSDLPYVLRLKSYVLSLTSYLFTNFVVTLEFPSLRRRK